jgi:Uncharacterised protein family (UPF0158)
MLDLTKTDLEELARALQDQGQSFYGQVWFVDRETGELRLWTEDEGVDGAGPVELDEVDGVVIEPIPSYVWYRDMVDFAEGISDERTGRRLGRALEGRGAFRRFKNELHEEYPELVSAWHAFQDARAVRRAVEWLVDNELVDEDAAERYLAEHPEPPLP